MDGKLVVDVSHQGEMVYSNFNERFGRGKAITVIQLPDGVVVALGGYAPPSWDYNFFRWLQNPARWFEASFDHITFPYLWFLAIFVLAIFALGFAVKSSYLERDVLTVLRKVELKYPQS